MSVEKEYDYVVIGSGLCSFSLVQHLLRNTQNTKVLVVERGAIEVKENISTHSQWQTNKKVNFILPAISETSQMVSSNDL
jgi:choline dehydrogenase-like flavoprotein